MKYIVPLQPRPTKEELEWAWKFTVFAKANGHCQQCKKQIRLDACHIKSQETFPELRFEPENGIALCRACHMSFDHKNGNRPSGRPIGYKVTPITKEKMKKSGQFRYATPESRETQRKLTTAQWDKIGRKNPPKPCIYCGKMLTQKQATNNRHFCSPICHYAFRKGKPRKLY